nr:MAG TPA: restriction alleviation protein [Caudoviricetes sp.]
MAELKHCPFCGESGELLHLQKVYHFDADNYIEWSEWKVKCENCGAETSESGAPELVIEAWNRGADNGNKTDM